MYFKIFSVFFFTIISFTTYAQIDTIIVTGLQIRQKDSNVKLVTSPIYIAHNYQIIGVNGDSSGFWIEDASGRIVQSFANSKSAIGYILQKGQYKIIPNLSPKETRAQIVVKLISKP